MVSGTLAGWPAWTRLTKKVNDVRPVSDVTVNGPGSAVRVSASAVAFPPGPTLIDHITLPGADGMLVAVNVTRRRPGRSGVAWICTFGRLAQSPRLADTA